ncbi:probable methyltransferase-like protein 24 [Parasteatoda tepidariorum]|uniref:probable methyltransferase-like protein 24 n=1 Tax=Parasteatoda tepidariorum TaxID=114398 RepID=UPI000A2C059E|nr:methyltransferase-like protein 24 [Parasteatoda tepidariorum]
MERVREHFYLFESAFRKFNFRRKSSRTVLITIFLLLVYVLLLSKRILFQDGIDRKREDIKRENAIDFERLLYYVQHPKTLCYTALSLGGQKDDKNRLDGDKIICQDLGMTLRPPCLVYSFGGNDEWSFEEEVVKFGCEVYTFDPSLKMSSHKHKANIWFHPFGISDFNEDRFLRKELVTWKMRTLDDIMEFLGHQNRTLDILKLDIEGDEWKVLEDMLEKKLFKKINHLCVEVHLHSGNWARKLQILRKLEGEGQMRFFSSRKNQVTRPRHVPGTRNRTEQLFYELAWFSDKNPN